MCDQLPKLVETGFERETGSAPGFNQNGEWKFFRLVNDGPSKRHNFNEESAGKRASPNKCLLNDRTLPLHRRVGIVPLTTTSCNLPASKLRGAMD